MQGSLPSVLNTVQQSTKMSKKIIY